MSDFTIALITKENGSELIPEFINFAKKVRSIDYHCSIPNDEHAKKLIELGLATGSTLWLIKDSNNQSVLRFSTRAHLSLKDSGALGFFEIDLSYRDVNGLMNFADEQIRSWFKARDIKKIAGPIDINTWFNYRFSILGKNFFPRYKWEPTTPPEYLTLFRQIGFKDLAYFHTVFFRYLRIGNFCLGTGAMKKSFKSLNEKGFTLRPFDKEHFMSQEVPLFHEISHEAFKEALLFEPIDMQSFKAIYAAAAHSYDSSPSSVLLSPSGETAGFIFAFYDGDYLVIKSIALKLKFQGMNLSSGMIYNAVRQSFAFNKKGTISALVRAGLPSESIEKNAQKTTWFTSKHHYVLLNKEIENE